MPNERDQHAGDEELATELADFFVRCDPVPEPVKAAARAAIEFRDLDVQIAELLRDSALEDKELAGVRGAGLRMLSFGVADRFVEVDVRPNGDRHDLTGYVVPAVEGAVRAEAAEEVAEALVDANGRFRLVRIPRGPIRLSIEAPGYRRTVTAWFAL